MSKITLTTKYLDKRHMIMGIIGSVCVVLILAFQFTNIDTQSIGKVNVANKQNTANPRSIIDWKDIDLHARDIGNHEFTGTISDNTKILQVKCEKYKPIFPIQWICDKYDVLKSISFS